MLYFKPSSNRDLKIVSSVFAPEDFNKTGDIEYKLSKSGNNKLFRVYIYIQGNSSHFVEKVMYQLHPSFKKNTVTAKRDLSNLNSSITIWTWGLFMVRAKVLLNTNEVIELEHQLDYDKEIEANRDRMKLVK